MGLNKPKQSRIVKLALAVAKRKKELRLINRDDPPDVEPPSAGIIWDGTDYLTSSDRSAD